MATVALFSLILIAYILFAVIIGTPCRPMTEGQASALVSRELPSGASISQVLTWLDVRQIEHGKYEPHPADGTDGVVLSIIRDTHRSFLVSSDIQLILAFDKRRQLRGYSVHTVLTGL